MHDLPTTEPDLDQFLEGFETCALPAARWTHAAHLLTGACYVHTLGPDAALVRMRERLYQFHLAHGGQHTPSSGYHETVTRFYIELLAALHAHLTPASRVSFAHQIVGALEPRRDLLTRFFSFDVLTSPEARARWIPPDLRPIQPDSL